MAANAEKRTAVAVAARIGFRVGTAEAVPFPSRNDSEAEIDRQLLHYAASMCRGRARGRSLISWPAVQQIHQRLVEACAHGMTLACPRDVADVYFDS